MLDLGILVAYPYLKAFEANRDKYHVRDWVLDSGAFTAFTTGKPIDLNAYTEKAKALLASDPQLFEVFALDVINDHEASLANARAMRDAGVPAIPAYHIGEPWSVLTDLCAEFDKVAIGGVAVLLGHSKMRFLEQCFARVWPKKLHGFGCGRDDLVMGFPWHSTDASTWQLNTLKFGNYRSLGGVARMKGRYINLRMEVDLYLRLEREAQAKWKREMAQLGVAERDGCRVRLSSSGSKKGMSALWA